MHTEISKYLYFQMTIAILLNYTLETNGECLTSLCYNPQCNITEKGLDQKRTKKGLNEINWLNKRC